MNPLSAAGLTPTESKCYIALIERNEWKPSDFAKFVSETRTNCYKILDKLVSLGLAERFDKNKKLHYRALNPAKLIELSRTEKEKLDRSEKELDITTQELMRSYFRAQVQPGVRYFQGEAELSEIYFDQIKTREPIYIIRPDYNMDIYDFDYMTDIRHMARKAEIPRFAITPDRPKAPINYLESDPYMLLKRTWIAADAYTAPVEWNSYGDKLAIMSFGKEATGLIIESPQIAEAFRQLYALLDNGLRSDPEYKYLPKKAKYIGSTAKNLRH